MRAALTARPHSVASAVYLLYASVAIGMVSIPVRLPHLPAEIKDASSSFIFGAMFSGGLLLLLTFLISRGHNWARILFLVLFLMGTLGSAWSLSLLVQEGPLSVTVYVGQATLQTIAIVLLFQRPARDWFNNFVGSPGAI